MIGQRSGTRSGGASVVLSEWSFDKCQEGGGLKWFKCRIVGCLKGHSNKLTNKFFYSREIKFVGAGREVIDINLTRYQLPGPANPVLHHTHQDVQTIMAPFSKGHWPADYDDRVKNIGLVFCPKGAGLTLEEEISQDAQRLNEQAQKTQKILEKMGIKAVSAVGLGPSAAKGQSTRPGAAILSEVVAAEGAGRSDDGNASVRCSLLGPSLLFRKTVFPFVSSLRRSRKSKWSLRGQTHAEVRHLPLQPPALHLLLLLRIKPHPLAP